MNVKSMLFVLALVFVLILSACGGGGEAPASDASSAVGDAAAGEALYQQTVIGSASAPGCVTCHSLEPGVVLVGPSHAGLAGRAGEYIEGMSAEAYLRESINDPNAHIVEGFSPGVMYQNYAEDLQAREVNNLIAYMLTLD